MAGHIKIDRKIVNWEWYSDPNMAHLFIYFILKANWKDGRWRGILVKRGQVITGRFKCSRDTGLSERQIRTCINKLKTTNEISVKTTNKYSIITICKYEIYQSKYNDNDQQNDQQVVSQATSKRPASDQQATTIEEEYNKNKEEEPIKPAAEESLIGQMIKIFKLNNPSYQITPQVHNPQCLQIAYRIAKQKGWTKEEIGNGKMKETLKIWETIVDFINADQWLATRGLIDLNSDKEWDRLIMKMTKAKKAVDVKKEEERRNLKQMGL